MKNMTIKEFENFISRDDWTHEQSSEVIDEFEVPREIQDDDILDSKLIYVTHVIGLASMTSTLDGVTITYVEGYDHDKGNADSLSYGTEGQDEIWTIEGLRVIDEDGDEYTPNELSDYISGSFDDVDVLTF